MKKTVSTVCFFEKTVDKLHFLYYNNFIQSARFGMLSYKKLVL